MKFAWIFATLYLLNGFGPSVVNSTCVLESDFGIILNCAFKKSGLFRVRNLGGVKAHVGLGFSVGDELGFNESLSNLEGNKRRSSSGRVAQTAQKRDNRIVVQNVQNPPTKVKTDRSVQSSNAIISTTPPVIRKKVTSGTTTPPFKPIPPALDPKLIIGSAAVKPTVPKTTSKQTIDPIPEFHAMPASVVNAYTSAQLSNEKISTETKVNHLSANNLLQRVMTTNSSDLNQNGLSAVELDIIARKEALKRKQVLIAAQKAADALTSTTTTTTQAPLTTKINPVRSGVAATANKYSTTSSKVMNAPKEYYPVGYDKNFDDNFVSRVELPETSFYCGDQKHFPGLYADEDLGCMVFHVCALTDDGLIMKSFLCPESTLFDQTILKCNWWFYVDCKNSKSLYDSNIPISKSYQLMKALTFFSSIKKDSSEKN